MLTNQRGISNPDPSYLTARDRDEYFSGESSVRFSSQDERARYEHAMLMQFVNAAEFAGSRIEFASHIKTEEVRSGVMMWLIATNAQGTIVAGQGFEWIQDTLDWHPRSVVEFLPDETVALMFGFRILGQGTLWADEVRITKVGADVPLTEPVSPRGAAALPPPNVTKLLDSPQNLDFENWDTSTTSYPDCAGSLESE